MSCYYLCARVGLQASWKKHSPDPSIWIVPGTGIKILREEEGYVAFITNNDHPNNVKYTKADHFRKYTCTVREYGMRFISTLHECL